MGKLLRLLLQNGISNISTSAGCPVTEVPNGTVTRMDGITVNPDFSHIVKFHLHGTRVWLKDIHGVSGPIIQRPVYAA